MLDKPVYFDVPVVYILAAISLAHCAADRIATALYNLQNENYEKLRQFDNLLIELEIVSKLENLQICKNYIRSLDIL